MNLIHNDFYLFCIGLSQEGHQRGLDFKTAGDISKRKVNLPPNLVSKSRSIASAMRTHTFRI
jgi:hypothetical protein